MTVTDASVSLVLSKPNLLLLCLVQFCAPHTCFCKYSWESLKSELCGPHQHYLRSLLLTSHRLSRSRRRFSRVSRSWAGVAAPSAASFSPPAPVRPLHRPWFLLAPVAPRSWRISSSDSECWETSSFRRRQEDHRDLDRDASRGLFV